MTAEDHEPGRLELWLLGFRRAFVGVLVASELLVVATFGSVLLVVLVTGPRDVLGDTGGVTVLAFFAAPVLASPFAVLAGWLTARATASLWDGGSSLDAARTAITARLRIVGAVGAAAGVALGGSFASAADPGRRSYVAFLAGAVVAAWIVVRRPGRVAGRIAVRVAELRTIPPRTARR